MRKLLILLTVATLSFSFVSHAQQTGRITGTVIDGSQKIIEASTITLLRTKDSSVAKMSFADKNGRFEFENIPVGKYMVSVSAVGHVKGFSESFEITADKNTVTLNTIELIPQSKAMSGVTVNAKKPLVEQKLDRTVINVEAAVTNVGSSALEVLEKSPGISVDKDGNISLKGKDGVIVLIDGRQTFLAAADLANLLRSMQANQLDQIEIMTNPPAKFDASGNAGVINIKTKKNKQMGYNGSISLGYSQSRTPKFNEAFNFNYRQGKVNLFTNLGHNYRNSFNEIDIQRNFRDAATKDITKHFEQESRMKNTGNSYNMKLGADYFASKKTTFGIVLNGFTSPGYGVNNSLTGIYQPPGTLLSQTKAQVIRDQKWENLGTNLNFRQLLDTSGTELTADLDYVMYNSKNNQSLTNAFFDAAGNPTAIADTLIGELPQQINIYSGKVDYTHPMKKGARFEAGIKTSLVKTDNDAVYDSLKNGETVHDYNRTNHFIYEENINAAYVNYSRPLSKKISGQFGLRMENTISKGHSTGLVYDTVQNNYEVFDSKFKRNYTQLFPTAYIQYTMNGKNSFVINYGRRIQRPNYQSLNPFINFLDRYTYQTGNPNLKPQFSHNVELSHLYKGIITTTLNYSLTEDIIQQVIEQNEEKNETYVRQANIAKRIQLGASVNVTTKFAKWHNGNVYVNVFNNKFEGIVNDTFVSLAGTTLALNAMQQFTFKKGWSGEVSGFYRSKAQEGVFVINGMGMMSVGIGKQIMKNNGSIRINVRDVFYSRKSKGESRYGNVDAKFQERGDSRVFNIGFTYRFSKGKMNGNPKRRASSAQEEANRVGAQN